MEITLSAGPTGHNAEAASPAELALGQAALAHGWPLNEPKTAYWTTDDVPAVLVHVESGLVILRAEDGGTFHVTRFASRPAGATYTQNALHDDIKQPGLSYRRFLALVEEHGLHDRERLRRALNDK